MRRVSKYTLKGDSSVWAEAIQKVWPSFGKNRKRVWLADPKTGQRLLDLPDHIVRDQDSYGETSPNGKMHAFWDLDPPDASTLDLYSTRPPIRWPWMVGVFAIGIFCIRRFGFGKIGSRKAAVAEAAR